MKLRTLIIDDEAVARNRLRLLCSGIEGIEVVGLAVDGHDALERIEKTAADLLLLDISMPGLDGVSVATTVERLESRPSVIFCTANDRYALAAFEVSAVDYLLKPVSRERLAHAIEKACRLRSPARLTTATKWLDHVWVPHRGAMIRVDVAELKWIEAERDYICLRTAEAAFLLHETMRVIETRLDPAIFVRLRRSTIVRKAAIRSLRHLGGGSWEAQMTDGTRVRVGATYLKAVKASLAIDSE